jgi:acetyl-CoA C-acetyltransferase
MKAVILASQIIREGSRNIVLAGGMESMSKVPHYVGARHPAIYGTSTAFDGIILDATTDKFNNIP